MDARSVTALATAVLLILVAACSRGNDAGVVTIGVTDAADKYWSAFRTLAAKEEIRVSVVSFSDNDPTNEDRAMRVLNLAGLIALRETTSNFLDTSDINREGSIVVVRTIDAYQTAVSLDSVNGAVVHADPDEPEMVRAFEDDKGNDVEIVRLPAEQLRTLELSLRSRMHS